MSSVANHDPYIHAEPEDHFQYQDGFCPVRKPQGPAWTPPAAPCRFDEQAALLREIARRHKNAWIIGHTIQTRVGSHFLKTEVLLLGLIHVLDAGQQVGLVIRGSMDVLTIDGEAKPWSWLLD